MNKYFQILFLAIVISCSYSQDTWKSGTFNIQKKTTGSDRPVIRKDPDNFDINLFRSINNSRSKFKDAVIPVFDRSAPPMALFLPLTTMVYSRYKKNYYDENTGYLTGGSEFLTLLLTFGVKSFFERPRPYTVLDSVYVKNASMTDPYSFPSGHTSIAFTMAVMLNLRYPDYPQVYVPAYLYGLIVAYGRPYLGMHYPSDLLGGAAIGAGSALLIYSLRKPLFKMKNNILSEDKPDEGSINGKNLIIFGSAFTASAILGQILFNDNQKIQLTVSPYGRSNEIMIMNLNVRF